MYNFFNYDKTKYDNTRELYENKQEIKDYGPNPFVINIEKATKENDNFRIALWTGEHLQITLMSIKKGECIGLEKHDNLDQFIRIERGKARVEMGKEKESPTFIREINDDDAFVIPAGTWHNLTNIGESDLKLYSIYAPPNHEKGVVEKYKTE